MKGVSLAELRKYEEAIIEFNKSIELDKSYILAYLNKGIKINQNKRKFSQRIKKI